MQEMSKLSSEQIKKIEEAIALVEKAQASLNHQNMLIDNMSKILELWGRKESARNEP